jgi:hypothetical protein
LEVAILSMQKVCNYGSFLQAYALQKTIEELGHNCSFINIEQGVMLPMHICAKNIIKENKLKWLIKKFDKDFLIRINHYIFAIKRSKMYENQVFPILRLQDNSVKERFDVVVIGSDEVFNCAQKTSWGFSKQLYGDIKNTSKIITYAASAGFTRIEDIDNGGIRVDIETSFSNISAFSVRDKNTYEIVEKLTGKSPLMHIDPTLIYNFDKYMPENIQDRNYILIYSYDNRISDENEIKVIKEFAKKHNKKLICVGFYQNWCDKNILATPFVFLRYIKNADYIITDTFHGTIFSIKYSKKFCTILRNTNNEKLYSLLEEFNLISRILNKVDDIFEVMKKEIDFISISEIIICKKNKAIDYLINEI